MAARNYYDPRDVSPEPRSTISRAPPSTAPAAAPSAYYDDRDRDRERDRDVMRSPRRDRPRSRSRGRARSASRSKLPRGPALAASAIGAVAATALDKYVVERFGDRKSRSPSRSKSRSRSRLPLRRAVDLAVGGWAGHEAYKHFRDKSEEDRRDKNRDREVRRDRDRPRVRARSQDDYYDDYDRRRGSDYDRRGSRAYDDAYASGGPRSRQRVDHRSGIDHQHIKRHLADVAMGAWGVGKQFQASRAGGGAPPGAGPIPMNDEMTRLAMKVAQGAYGIGKEYWANRQHGGGGGGPGGFHY